MNRHSAVPEPADPRRLPPGPGAVNFSNVKLLLPDRRPGRRKTGWRSTGSTWPSTAAKWSPWSGPPVRARQRSCPCWPACTTRPTASCTWTAWTSATSACRAVRQAVAVVFEDSFLFDDTIDANLRVGRPGRHGRRNWPRPLTWHRPTSSSDELPLGYKTPVGERGMAPLGRPAPARRPGPRPAGRPPRPGARRRHLGRGRAPGATGREGPGRGPDRQDDAHNFPPSGNHRRRRPGRADRRRPGRGPGHPRASCGPSHARYRQVLGIESVPDEEPSVRR